MLPEEELSRDFKKTWMAFIVSSIDEKGREHPLPIRRRYSKLFALLLAMFLCGFGASRIGGTLGMLAVESVLVVAFVMVVLAYIHSSSRRRSWASIGERPPIAKSRCVDH